MRSNSASEASSGTTTTAGVGGGSDQEFLHRSSLEKGKGRDLTGGDFLDSEDELETTDTWIPRWIRDSKRISESFYDRSKIRFEFQEIVFPCSLRSHSHSHAYTHLDSGGPLSTRQRRYSHPFLSRRKLSSLFTFVLIGSIPFLVFLLIRSHLSLKRQNQLLLNLRLDRFPSSYRDASLNWTNFEVPSWLNQEDGRRIEDDLNAVGVGLGHGRKLQEVLIPRMNPRVSEEELRKRGEVEGEEWRVWEDKVWDLEFWGSSDRVGPSPFDHQPRLPAVGEKRRRVLFLTGEFPIGYSRHLGRKIRRTFSFYPIPYHFEN